MLENIPKAAKKPERLDKWLSKANAESTEQWYELRQKMKKDGVEPSSLEFLRAEEDECEEMKGIFTCDDIMVYANSNIGEVKFKIDDPIKIGRGWVIEDYVKYRKRQSELHQKAEKLVNEVCACGDDSSCKLKKVQEAEPLAKEIGEAEDQAAAAALARLKDCF